jgi:hypothetical protein
MCTVLADTFLRVLVVPPFVQVAGTQAAYHGLAEYYQSLVCKAEKSVGEEIARLEVSNKLISSQVFVAIAAQVTVFWAFAQCSGEVLQFWMNVLPLHAR